MSGEVVIVHGDITKLSVDAIVNAANTSLLGGGGVDGAIHRAAGKELAIACRQLSGCKIGQAKITRGFNLPCKWIIHTVGPYYRGGNHGEGELLASCYLKSLELAVQYQARTIAFPCISTGIYRFPFLDACKIAIATITDFLQEHSEIEEVSLVCFSKSDYDEFSKVLSEKME